MRLLPERADHDGQGAAGQESESDRCADPRGDEQDAVPLHDVLPGSGGHQARGEAIAEIRATAEKEVVGMTAFTNIPKQVEEVLEKSDVTIAAQELPQERRPAGRELRRRGRASVGSGGEGPGRRSGQRGRSVSRPRLPSTRFVDRRFMRTTPPPSTSARRTAARAPGTSFRQLMSDELDIAYDKTTCIMGSTDITVDQGGSGGSTAMERDALADAARRGRSSPRAAGDGIDAARRAGRSAGRQRRRDHGEGRSLEARHLRTTDRRKEIQRRADREQYQRDHRRGQGRRPVQELKIVGQSPQRYDIPAKVDGSLKWAVDVKLPGMVHARNVKPPFAGAKLTEHR